MITATLQYELLHSGVASCVLCLDTNQADEVVLHTAPLHVTQSGQFINLDEGMPGSNAPPHTTDSAAYDSARQRHVWHGKLEDQRMLTIEVMRDGALLGWAAMKYEQGQFFVPLALLFDIDLQVRPLSSSPHAELSHACAAGSTPGEGEDDWRRVVRAYARERRVEEVLSLFAQRAGRYAAGMTQGDAETFRHIGFFLAVQGHLAQALSAFDLVLREQPTDTDVISARGIILQEMGRHAEAERAFRSALALDEGRGVAWELLGDALLLADGDPVAALLAYERAITLNPERASAYHGKGNALSRSGRMQEALIAYERAVWLDPCEPRYRERLQAFRGEHSLCGPSPGQGPLWDLFALDTRLGCEAIIALVDDLITERRGRALAEGEVLTIELDALPADPPAAAVQEEVNALYQAFLELWHRRIALPWHPWRALRYRRAQAGLRDAALQRLAADYHRFHQGAGGFLRAQAPAGRDCQQARSGEGRVEEGRHAILAGRPSAARACDSWKGASAGISVRPQAPAARSFRCGHPGSPGAPAPHRQATSWRYPSRNEKG